VAGRFDLAVSSVAGISRAHAQRLISDGRARIDGRRGRASDRLRGGERIEVELSAPPDEDLLPEQIPLRIAYEDASTLVVDKPAGLVVHPSAGHSSGTLVNALLGRAEAMGEPLAGIAGVGRPGIVHRLDKDTSGLLVVAKTDEAQASLMRQFGLRTIDKEYVALVRGAAPAPRGRIEAPVGRHPRDRQRMAVVADGREADSEQADIGFFGWSVHRRIADVRTSTTVQYAKAMGLHVGAVDIDDGKLAHAKLLGADAVVNAKTGDAIQAVRQATDGGAHGVLITAPSLAAFKQGVGMTRKRGTCVLVGLPPGEFPTPLFDVVANCITIRGSFVGTRRDMAEALAFAAEGKVKADSELQPLSAINNVFERLAHGDVPSRVVLDFAGR